MGNKSICDCSENVDQWIEKCKQESQKLWIKSLSLSKYERTGKPNENYKVVMSSHNGEGVIYGSFYYEGQISNNQAHGKGIQRFPLSPTSEGRYVGQFCRNQRQGKGKYQGDNVIFQGKWMNGFPSCGELFLSKKKFFIKSLTSNDQQLNTGYISIELPDHSTYEGQFVKNGSKYCFEGTGTIKMPNEQQYAGMWRLGKFEGQGVYKWKSFKYVGGYHKGLKHGEGQYYLTANKYMKGTWANGKRNGTFKIIEDSYTQSTQICVLKYENDKIIDNIL